MIRRPKTQPVPAWSGPKPTLPMIKVPVYRIHYEDLQEYLLKVFRMEIDVLAALRIPNGMFPEIIVTGRMPPAWNARQQADNIRRGRPCRNLGLILDVLCLDGFIPAGKYILDTHARQKPIDRYRETLQRVGDPLHQDCLALKEKYHGDRQFRQQAQLMDKAVLAYRRQS